MKATKLDSNSALLEIKDIFREFNLFYAKNKLFRCFKCKIDSMLEALISK